MLLVGMCRSKDTLGNNLIVSYKVKIHFQNEPTIPLNSLFTAATFISFQ
jgi:hypothetical protein